MTHLAEKDLRCADLKGENMRGADLRGKDMLGADLRNADLFNADLREANMRGTILIDADLFGADLSNANLNSAIGNMKEVKSAQFDHWQITWVTDPDDGPILHIGCQRHPLEKWEKANTLWLAKMDPRAVEWANKYLSLACQLVRASPAVPYVKRGV